MTGEAGAGEEGLEEVEARPIRPGEVDPRPGDAISCPYPCPGLAEEPAVLDAGLAHLGNLGWLADGGLAGIGLRP